MYVYAVLNNIYGFKHAKLKGGLVHTIIFKIAIISNAKYLHSMPSPVDICKIFLINFDWVIQLFLMENNAYKFCISFSLTNF